MNKRNIKLVSAVLIILIVFSIFLPYRTYAGDRTVGGIFSGAQQFIDDANPNDGKVIQEDDMIEMSNMLYNALLVVAIVILVIIGFIIGIKIMTDSAAEKAKTKETLIPYIAGCIVVFGAFGIWKLIVNLLSQTQ